MLRAWTVTAVLFVAALICALMTARRIAGSPVPAPPAAEQPIGYRHVIAPGETLRRISQDHYGTPDRWKEIALANRITDASRLAVGNALIIPGYVPPPPPGTEGREEELRLLSPVRDAFPWPSFARILLAYLVSAALAAAAVVAYLAATPEASPVALGRSGAVMAAAAISFASVMAVAGCFGSLWAGRIAGSTALAACMYAAAVAAAFGAVLVLLKSSFRPEAREPLDLKAGLRFLTLMAVLASAGGLYLVASGSVARAAAYADSGLKTGAKSLQSQPNP